MWELFVDFFLELLADFRGGSSKDNVANKRQKLAEARKINCPLQLLNGHVEGLSSTWRRCEIAVLPGSLVVKVPLSLATSFHLRRQVTVEIPVLEMKPNKRPLTSRDLSKVPDESVLYQVTTPGATIEWALPFWSESWLVGVISRAA